MKSCLNCDIICGEYESLKALKIPDNSRSQLYIDKANSCNNYKNTDNIWRF